MFRLRNEQSGTAHPIVTYMIGLIIHRNLTAIGCDVSVDDGMVSRLPVRWGRAFFGIGKLQSINYSGGKEATVHKIKSSQVRANRFDMEDTMAAAFSSDSGLDALKRFVLKIEPSEVRILTTKSIDTSLEPKLV